MQNGLEQASAFHVQRADNSVRSSKWSLITILQCTLIVIVAVSLQVKRELIT
jgi:hypothetical protein